MNIADIKGCQNNPRRNDQAVDAVAASIQRFGFRQPIVVDENGDIVVGHARYKAALKLGLQQVPVHVAKGLSPAQIRAYRIADNKTAELAEWNHELLVQELVDLQGMNFDLDLVGFSADELTRLLEVGPTSGLTDPDDAPELPDEARTKSGDLWLLGSHRLLCGDSGKLEHLERLLDGAPVHLVVTGPPSGLGVEPRSKNPLLAGPGQHQKFDGKRYPEKSESTTKKMRAKDRPLANDCLGEAEFIRLLHIWFGNIAHMLQPGRAFYIWGGYSNLANFPPVLRTCGLHFSQAIVWTKGHPVLTKKDFMGDFELAFYGWREGAGHQFFGPNNAVDVWDVKKIHPQEMIHLTEKPVELATRAIQYSSRKDETVLDPFGGSGSALIGAEQTCRRAFLMEVDPWYCDLIVARWEKFTGQKASLAEESCNKLPFDGSR
jgi:DNA modification methylase